MLDVKQGMLCGSALKQATTPVVSILKPESSEHTSSAWQGRLWRDTRRAITRPAAAERDRTQPTLGRAGPRERPRSPLPPGARLGVVLGVACVQRNRLEVQLAVQVHCRNDVLQRGDDARRVHRAVNLYGRQRGGAWARSGGQAAGRRAGQARHVRALTGPASAPASASASARSLHGARPGTRATAAGPCLRPAPPQRSARTGAALALPRP